MEKIKRLVYILAAQKDEKLADILAKKIDCDRVSADILCGQSARERNASAANCDLCVVVISENTESDEDARVESSVNTLTNKPMVRFIARDEALSDSMEYYLAKTEAISEEDGDFRERICAILDDLPYKKDVLIYAAQQEEDIAEQVSYDLLQKGISNITISGYEEYCALLENCSAAVIVGQDKASDFVKKAIRQAKRRKKAALSLIGWDRQNTKVFSRVIQRTVSALNRIKPASKTMLVADTGKVKLTHKPVFAIACAIISLQICAVFLWLLSINREPLYALPIVAVLAGYVYVFLRTRDKCAIKGCTRKHNGRKCSVIVTRKGNYRRGRIIKLCDAHFDTNDVSDYKNKNFVMPAATGLATLLFFLFVIFSGAKVGDISFLSVIQAFQTLQTVKFEDPGFEAFVRQEFDIRDTKISRERLMDIKELHFNVDSTPEEVSSLSDLRYFPSLRVFHVDDMQMMEVRGDIKNFKYTPEIESIELGSGDFYGDIKVLSRLKKLKWLNKSYVRMEIYGDISAFSKLNDIESIHMPDCDITGNISELSDLRPYMLVLTMTNVSGDISSLSACDSLVDLLIDSGDISGDLSSISNLSKLEHLELADNEITGKISDLMGMRLKGVDLSYTLVSGTLKEIASIDTFNEVIRFSNCINITGDISDLSELSSRIKSICISQNPQLTGGLSAFAEFSELEELELFLCSNLSGDIAEISKLDRLQYIRFGHNNFTGDIAAFKNMKDLYTLMVSETPVYGDIAELSNLSKLKDLVLNNTGVFGDIAVFANMPKIHNIEVDGTGVYGDLSSLEGLEELYQVNIGNSLVNGNEQRLHMPKDKDSAFNMLMDTRVIFTETARQIGENMGQNLGEAKSAQLSEDAQVYMISAKKDGDYIIGRDFSKFGDFRNNNRAVKVKFRADNLAPLSISLFDNDEIALKFEKGSPLLFYQHSEYMVNYNFGYRELYSNYMDTNLILEPGKWYWAIMAVSGEGQYRSLVWEDENEDNFAYCAQRLGPIANRDDLDWHLTFGMDGECNLDIAQYSIMDFEGFYEQGMQIEEHPQDDPQPGDNQEQEEEMPTISGLGIIDGEYYNESEGFKMKIYSTAWNGAQEDMVHFEFTIYDVAVVVDIHYPDNIFEITVDEQFTYKYRPMDYTVVEGPEDLQQRLDGYFGENAGMISERILEHINAHCTDAFGYPPRELIMMMYE